MRGGKSESKIAGPLFPRLHVNDAEKGGPKPPPRNKMALYEQLSIPSQRFTDTPTSNSPLPSVYGGTLTNLESSSQISGAFYNLNGRQRSCSSDRANEGLIKRLMNTTHTGDITVTEGAFPTTMCTFQPCNILQSKRPYLLKNEAESNPRGLLYPAVNWHSTNHHPNWSKERILFSPGCPLQLRADVSKRLKPTSSGDRESEGHLKVFNREDPKMQEAVQGRVQILCNLSQASHETAENGTSGVEARDVLSSKSLQPLAQEEHSEPSNRVPTSSNSHKCDSDGTSSSGKAGGFIDVDMRANKVPNADVPEQIKLSIRNDPHVLRSVSFHESPLTYGHNRPHNAIGSNYPHEEETEHSPLSANVLRRNKDLSAASVMHTMSCAFISPDDVVEMMGHTHFLKARKAIINQQRVFSMQVFELHRIIKVQKVLAGSKNLLIEESLTMGKAFSKSSSTRELSMVNSKHDASKVSDISVVDNITTVDKRSRHDFGKAPVVSSSLNNNLPMWCLPQLGNQWLVPVMSPSEGLIYKPYSEHPCPPTVGFRADICGPTSAIMSRGELLNSTSGYSFHVAPPIAPYGLSIMSPFAPASSIEHVGATTVHHNDLGALYQSSCIVATERKVGDLFSKDSEKPECRTSFPEKRTPDDALPLFPTDSGSVEPASTGCSEQKTRVIKVIPHNPRLASESAARIIQLIQEERKHTCN